ncbi:MAG: sugar ABC transporter substrate-binding protein, partial [Clostridia bacterium]|nr:sugar ABC transporter substrate-binding protein [Clostridia bacterium]
MKKLVAFLLAAMMCVTALTACGGSGGSSSDSGSSSGSGEKAKAITVNIWDSNQQKGIQEIADKWTETSGVKVNVEVVDWDNYWTLLEAGASGGTMPDVFWMHSNTAQMYMENDILLKLNDYIEKDKTIDMSKYYEGVKNLYTRTDGNIYALPKDHDTIALLYNKAIFDKYGVQYPTDKWTWEDMYAAAKKISEDSKGEVYGMAMNTSNNQDGWYNLIYSYGGQVITDDHKGTTIGSDKAKAGMEMTRKLLTVGAPQSVVAETGTDSLFMSGKVGMITQGSWMINAFYTAEGHANYAWALLPYADLNGNGTCEKEERWSAYNGLGWAASAKTKDPESCYSLIAYFCGEEGQKLQAEKGVTMGGMQG